MKRITFTIDGHSFSQDFSSDLSIEEEREEILEEREKCVKEISEITGKHYG